MNPDGPVGIEDGSAGAFAGNRLVDDRRQVLALLEGGVEGGDRDDGARRLNAG